MPAWHRSPIFLKLFVGQHILNGASVAAIVVVVTVSASLIFGFDAGQPATLGAVAASIGDFPAPLANKRVTLSVGFVLALLSTISIQLVTASSAALIVDVGATAFIAGILTGYGRWALALSMQMLIPMVFVLGLPPTNFAGALRNEGLLAGGGVVYIVIALLITAITDAGGRRLMASECIRELANYLRAIAGFYDEDIDIAQTYGAVIRQQAALSDQTQSARALLLDAPYSSPARTRLAASIGILMDALDTLVATHPSLDDLRRSPATSDLRAELASVLRRSAGHLDRLSLDLLSNAEPHLPADHALARDDLQRETDRLARGGAVSEETLAAAQATTRRLNDALDHFLRLERALRDDAEAEASMRGIDLAQFTSRPSFSLSLLAPHFTPNSPVFRFAVRLSLAMMAGALVATSLGSAGHGNWIMLTIAVVMRASYGLTRQRRDDRIIGTLFGCLIAAALVAFAPVGALVAAQVIGLGVAHGFARLRYRVTSTGASVVALVSLHLVSPTESAPILTRVTDTLVGAALAQLFSHLLPRWEFLETGRLASRLLGEVSAYANVALSTKAPEQEYRLVRKRMIEAIAALSDSSARMSAEPRAVRRGTRELSSMLIAAYGFAALLTATRVALRARRAPPVEDIGAELEATRAWIADILNEGAKPRRTKLPADDDSHGDAFEPLRKSGLVLIEAVSAWQRVTKA
jgi:uncharacterized membrane protein YccC